MQRKSSKERGQALILIALAAIGLFAITGLAIDGSAKFSDRRHAQNAADASAMAGALANVRDDPQWKLAALDRALENGYDDNHVSNEVEVYTCDEAGSDCGPYDGDSEYVQVIITSHVDTSFARVIGINETQNTVRAVALTQEGGVLGDGAMLIAYNPHPTCGSGTGSGGGSVDVSGTSQINLNGGGIFLNSQESCGYATNCTELNITGGAINSAGDNIDQDGCAIQAPENPNQDPIAIPDDIYWPDVPPECSMGGYPPPKKLGAVMAGSPPKLTEEWLIYPGYYQTFPQANLVANKSHIYMASGVYCIDPGGPSWNGDLSWSSVDSAKLIGSIDPITNKYQSYNPDGVTLYIKSGGGFALNSNNPTFLDASTTGDYQGYLIILEGTQTSIESCSISGGADLDINGLIFAPYCNITVNGSSSSTAVINAQLIGWNLKINGGAGINFHYNPDNAVHIKNKLGLIH